MRADLAGLKCVCDKIARAIKGAESSAIFLLVGDIGAGKTTLVREFAKQVGIKESVTSPTFSLLHIYNAESSADSANPPLSISLDSFSQKGCTPHPAPPNFFKICSQKLPLFAFRGRASLSPLLAKNRHSHYCSFESDFLHHEAGEFSGASHGFDLDSANQAQSAESSDKIQSKKPFKSFCYFWLSPKVESPLPLNPNLPNNADSAISQNLTLFSTIYHYDLFNRNLSELLELGLLDLLSENGIHFVEWGDRRLFEIIKDAFENIFILQITKAKNDRIYELKREF